MASFWSILINDVKKIYSAFLLVHFCGEGNWLIIILYFLTLFLLRILYFLNINIEMRFVYIAVYKSRTYYSCMGYFWHSLQKPESVAILIWFWCIANNSYRTDTYLAEITGWCWNVYDNKWNQTRNKFNKVFFIHVFAIMSRVLLYPQKMCTVTLCWWMALKSYDKKIGLPCRRLWTIRCFTAAE